MEEQTFFDYYYGGESEQFAFYRIPRQLVTGSYFKNLSTDAKLLYGLLLDRMSLSMKNGWYDEQGRVYICAPSLQRLPRGAGGGPAARGKGTDPRDQPCRLDVDTG